jgi:hypothetical protein
MLGFDREDVASGRLRWTDLTPPEWLGRDTQQYLPEMKRTGSLQPYEKECFRKDGRCLPALIGTNAPTAQIRYLKACRDLKTTA